MAKQIIYKQPLTDLEAARLIEQGLTNLPESYPYRDMAHMAFGRLILGSLNLMPEKHIRVIPRKKGGMILIKYNGHARRLIAKCKTLEK